MADDTRIDNAVDARANTEPATAHDVKEGGVLGAVGGAIVGALAGGPVGAVIGAVAGGAASAGAVDVVDKHDHDYERTVANHDTAAVGADRDTAYGIAASAPGGGGVASEGATLSGLGTGTLGQSTAFGGGGAASGYEGASRRDYDEYGDGFRSHYESNYAGTGASYDDYDPAYRYGHGLASDARYQNSDWTTVESGARSDWETRQPGTWDRFKGSVQHAYDHAKAKV